MQIDAHLIILTNVLEKVTSRRTLLQFLHDAQIPYEPTDNLRCLRSSLRKYIRHLQKSNVLTSHTKPQSSCSMLPMSTESNEWPLVIPQSLKDKIASTFVAETSSEKLRSFICSSCSSSAFLQERVSIKKSSINLSCLQHLETHLSGMPPNLNHMIANDLNLSFLTEGILLDHRGIENEDLHFCKDCFAHIKKGNMPPLSLANHLLLGDVPPELADLTPVEESMITRCQAKSCVIQLKSDEDIFLPNSQRALQGHIIIYPQKPENLLTMLPPSLENTCMLICVVFIGSQKPSQE